MKRDELLKWTELTVAADVPQLNWIGKKNKTMKKIILLPAVIAIALMSGQTFALSSFPSGTVGIGGATPGAERDTSGGTTDTTDTSTDTTKGNGKGKGKGKGNGKSKGGKK